MTGCAALLFEYVGLIGVFVAYAFLSDGTTAATLYEALVGTWADPAPARAFGGS